MTTNTYFTLKPVFPFSIQIGQNCVDKSIKNRHTLYDLWGGEELKTVESGQLKVLKVYGLSDFQD